jgi:23S rRNA (uracil1939-C5)-methyltransferase
MRHSPAGRRGRARLPVEAVHRDCSATRCAPTSSPASTAWCSTRRAPARASRSLQLAASSVSRIAYISCNPSSWARDARLLADAGYRLAELRPVGQFRWSTHVELASLFVRSG